MSVHRVLGPIQRGDDGLPLSDDVTDVRPHAVRQGEVLVADQSVDLLDAVLRVMARHTSPRGADGGHAQPRAVQGSEYRMGDRLVRLGVEPRVGEQLLDAGDDQLVREGADGSCRVDRRQNHVASSTKIWAPCATI